ncbi:hypothetical protein RvY_09354 [Ramazzottius varieornatus]|uniref:Uncharacterized protein n=1 Tax=Ramazzottius varieornatus TaxID=947166 RepID=A0A1D1V948_RAMVA|nr:hypothetical protein RvY_09354 [Ramazzottius varieornatus]
MDAGGICVFTHDCAAEERHSGQFRVGTVKIVFGLQPLR